ncbi:aldo/keto reductase [Subtercola boreus]|nr:aldo/keto reductase [Subtercola boreus]
MTFGTMTFGAQGAFLETGSTDLEKAREQVLRCIDAGVNMFDTANMYSLGNAETVLGQALGDRRDDVLIATKVRLPMSEGVNDAGLSRRHIIAACEASLRRLGTDYIDLYQMHEWDGLTPVEETLDALDKLVSSGKVRYIGVSNFAGWHIMKYLAVAGTNHLPRIVSQQIYYSLQAREAEYELLPIAEDQGLGVLVYSPLAGGLLSGKYRSAGVAPKGSRHLGNWSEPPVRNTDQLYNIVELLIELSSERGITPSQLALAYTLSKPTITSVVIGARTTEQLTANLLASEVELSTHEISVLDDASRLPLIYPYWHQAAKADGRFSAADLVLLRQFIA